MTVERTDRPRAPPPRGVPRTIFAPEHEMFRDSVRRFLDAEVVPHHAAWEAAKVTPREVWRKAGALGLLGAGIPEAYGGSGGGFLYDSVLIEELGRSGATGPGWDLCSCIIAPYLTHYGTEAQKRRWLPGVARGEIVLSIAMTEPDAGSDLKAIRTRARRDGDVYVVDGAKTFITHAILSDLVLVVAKTDPSAGARGVSLLLVEASTPGLRKGRNLDKIGLRAQDTGELFFDGARVPAENLLGEEGEGWRCLMAQLVQERLVVAIRSMAIAETALDQTVEYTRRRRAFDGAVFDFQNTRFALAGLAAEIQAARVFTDRCIDLHAQGALDAATAAMAKLTVTELQNRVLDACLQLHGGNGYMWDSPIARAWADSRVHRIYAGSNEIMKEIIARTL